MLYGGCVQLLLLVVLAGGSDLFWLQSLEQEVLLGHGAYTTSHSRALV